jgi:hypothetical protein
LPRLAFVIERGGSRGKPRLYFKSDNPFMKPTRTPRVKIRYISSIEDATLAIEYRCPVVLAEGLTPENVLQAIEEVGPYGLDLCSSRANRWQAGCDEAETFLRGGARYERD